jgi:hypothetical protein
MGRKMNDRIQQLAEQAKFMAEEDINRQISYNTELKAFAEKFAELIVTECIDIIAPYTVRMSRPGEEYLHPIQEINEHFGVKE